jgi:hypothetical protein
MRMRNKLVLLVFVLLYFQTKYFQWFCTPLTREPIKVIALDLSYWRKMCYCLVTLSDYCLICYELLLLIIIGKFFLLNNEQSIATGILCRPSYTYTLMIHSGVFFLLNFI